MSTQPKFVKTGEASRILGFSQKCLQLWHDSGELKADYVSHGGTRWYDIERVIRELKARGNEYK